MDLGLTGLRVLVTAGAGGIGLAIARAFVREGEQLADLAVFVASPRGRTISGQALSVCGDTNMLS